MSLTNEEIKARLMKKNRTFEVEGYKFEFDYATLDTKVTVRIYINNKLIVLSEYCFAYVEATTEEAIRTLRARGLPPLTYTGHTYLDGSKIFEGDIIDNLTVSYCDGKRNFS